MRKGEIVSRTVCCPQPSTPIGTLALTFALQRKYSEQDYASASSPSLTCQKDPFKRLVTYVVSITLLPCFKACTQLQWTSDICTRSAPHDGRGLWGSVVADRPCCFAGTSMSAPWRKEVVYGKHEFGVALCSFRTNPQLDKGQGVPLEPAPSSGVSTSLIAGFILTATS